MQYHFSQIQISFKIFYTWGSDPDLTLDVTFSAYFSTITTFFNISLIYDPISEVLISSNLLIVIMLIDGVIVGDIRILVELGQWGFCLVHHIKIRIATKEMQAFR